MMGLELYARHEDGCMWLSSLYASDLGGIKLLCLNVYGNHPLDLSPVYLSWDTSLLVESRFLLHKPLSFRKTYFNQCLEVKERWGAVTNDQCTAEASHLYSAEGTEI